MGIKKGNSNIELIMVVMLMILFGSTIYKLIEQGKQTQEKIISNKSSQVNARIALSFINVRLRQNDSIGRIEIKQNNINKKNSIVIKERGEFDYDTWIYFANGKLMECIVDVGAQPIEQDSSIISNVDDFDVIYDSSSKLIKNTISYTYNKNQQNNQLESVIHLRSINSDIG